MNESRINRIGLAGLAASFVLLIVAFVAIVFGFATNQRASQLVMHTYDVKEAVSAANGDLERAEATRRGYLLDPSLYRLQVFQESSAQVMPKIDRVRYLTSDNPAQRARADRLKALLQAQIRIMNRTMEIAREGRIEDARREFDLADDGRSMVRIRALADLLAEEEEKLLTERLAFERRSLSYVQWLLAGVGLALLVASLGTMWILRRYTRDLLASRARLHVLNTNLEGAVAERTADLKRANDEIQRFAYIVSHDLRSPLVNIMGFTSELETAGNDLADFIARVDKKNSRLIDDHVRTAALEDLPESIEFIRTSTQKMDRLINAILTLSRQGRRVLTPERLDMAKLVGDIVDGSLATLAAERGAAISVEGKLPTIHHDRLAIEQILQNLLENATKYSRPGVPGNVVVRGSSEGGRAKFEIEDNGRGIAPGDHERIFDLFRRAGTQDQKGEGIGLAHVRALANRLGGTVTVRSALNEGSTFIVDLPVTYEAVGGSSDE